MSFEIPLLSSCRKMGVFVLGLTGPLPTAVFPNLRSRMSVRRFLHFLACDLNSLPISDLAEHPYR